MQIREFALDVIPPPLAAGEVHLWSTRLDRPAAERARLQRLLSSEETARARRFVRPSDAEHFVAARGTLRGLLGGYLGIAPERVAFRYGEHGKPELAEDLDGGRVRFNLSHSHGLALVAVARGRAVGVDVEYLNRRVEYEQIAPRFFSASENAALLLLPVELRREGFFRCWTRKEAYIKAIGEGLSHPLSEFDVTLAPGEPARLLATRRDPAEAARWEMVDLTPAPGYAAALAVPRRFEVAASPQELHPPAD